MSVHPARHQEIPAGKRCQHCPRTEADCARVAGCCTACTHWDDLDQTGNKLDRRANNGRHLQPCEVAR